MTQHPTDEAKKRAEALEDVLKAERPSKKACENIKYALKTYNNAKNGG